MALQENRLPAYPSQQTVDVLLHKRIFQGLLRGDPSSAQELDIQYGHRACSDIQAGRYRLFFSTPYFALLKLQFVGENRMHHSELHGWSKTPEALTTESLIRSVFEDYLSPVGDAYYLEVDGHWCVLLNLSSFDPADLEAEGIRQARLLKACAQQAIAAMSCGHGIRMSAAISSVCCGCQYIQRLFREVKRLAEYQRVLDYRELVITYQDASPRSLGREQKTQMHEIEKKYMMAVLSSQYQDAGTYLLDLLDICCQDEFTAVASLSFKVMNHVNFALSSQFFDIYTSDPDPDGIIAAARELQATQSLSRTKQLIAAIMEKLECYHREHELSSNGQVVRIMQYVETHYDCPDLSIPMISEAMDISSQHLTRLLKAHTGMGALELIHSTRIDAAARLLKHTTKSISEISVRVGYTNQWTFFRNFKQINGITPGEYRRICRTTDSV